MDALSFTVQGDYSRDDYFEAVTQITKRSLRRNAKLLRDWKGFLKILPLIFVVALAIALMVVLRVADLSLGDMAVMILFVLLVLTVLVYRQRRLLYLLPKEGGVLMRRYENTLNAQGFYHNSSLSSLHIQWAGVLLAEETKHLLLLYVDRNVAFYIPKRHFEDETHWTACLAYAQQQIAAAHAAS